MRRISLPLIIIIIALCSCNDNKPNTLNIIPEPLSTTVENGSFTFNANFIFKFENVREDDPIIKTISDGMYDIFKALPETSAGNCKIFFIINDVQDQTIGTEGYKLNINKKGITINANTSAGLFYGYQTLLQLAPEDIYSEGNDGFEIPCLQITDCPRFEWRGTHLDVCRHFFDVDFIKKYIDILAMHKINKFHWHLTDDHGWRVQIDKYPLLTSVGAWRVDRSNVPWSNDNPPKPGEKCTYGGYYTKEQMKDIVAYAKARNIDVVPEIEMPGHTAAILAAYPEISCENDNDEDYFVQVGPYWPPVAILCAGKDQSLQMMKDILDEVMEIFPYEYIHVGGDEAYKTNWIKCPLCQKRIKKLGLQNEEELQSWFMQEIEKHIIAHGRKMIGWDEILEGGVSPTATVMSWRGEDGGIAAAKKGNSVIMVPNNHCYLDYYQADPLTEPIAIGGYVTLKTAYGFEPIPKTLNADEAKFIKGGQCNVWTEFINTSDHVEYMLLPRLAAIAESVWSSKENKDWPKFQDKVESITKRYESLGYKYCKGEFKPSLSTTSNPDGSLTVSIDSEKKNAVIHYTTDGTNPTLESPVYSSPFNISKSTTVKAAMEDEGKMRPNIISVDLVISKLVGKKITMTPEADAKYAGKGVQTVNDGEFGGISYNNGKWLGFRGGDVTFIIENNGTPASKLFVDVLVAQPDWIMGPDYVEISTSENGTDYEKVSRMNPNSEEQTENKCQRIEYQFNNTISPKYFKVVVKAMDKLPEWHSAAGGVPWLFIDEIWTE